MKNKNSKNKIYWHNLIPGLKLGCVIAFTVLANAAMAQNAPAKKQNQKSNITVAKYKLDSLNDACSNLFNIAQEKYFDRIDKKYTMGLFFTPKEISQLNNVMTPYIKKMAGESDFGYKYAKMNMPIRKDLPLNTFVEMVYILGVKDEELAPFDMVFSNGHLYMFADKKRAELFESFLAESYDGFLDDDDVPNYSIPEFAKIRNEYDNYLQQIDSLNNVVYQNDSAVCKTLRDIDNIREYQPSVKNARYVLTR
ncbi:MAG: hypothetical protein J5742_03295 [Alphaproteobacteria bacterium]|nr:hypothetical protein [Alphaproteobacteria bacterium]